MARKKKRSTLWDPDRIPNQEKFSLKDTLQNYWIPLLEDALDQAKQLLEKLERDR